MKLSNGVLLGSGIALLAAGGIALGLRSPAPEETPGGVGAPVPPFRAQTIDAPVKTRTPVDYRGDVLVLNVWATWCPPCVEEMPSFQKLHEAYAEEGLRIVAISIDDPGAADLIRAFRATHGLTFEILHDPESMITDLLPRFAVPQTLVIDRRGRIRVSRYADDWSSEENRKLVRSLLAESADEL
jgi:peroxiredoxin